MMNETLVRDYIATLQMMRIGDNQSNGGVDEYNVVATENQVEVLRNGWLRK